MKPHWLLFGMAGALLLLAPVFRPAQRARHSPLPNLPAKKADSASIPAENKETVWDAHPRALQAITPEQAEPASPLDAPKLTFDTTSAEASSIAAVSAGPSLTQIKQPDEPISSVASPKPLRASRLLSANKDRWTKPTLPPLSSGGGDPRLKQVIDQVRSTKEFVEEQFATLQRQREATERELSARRQQVTALEQRLSLLVQQVAERDRKVRELESLRDSLKSDLSVSEEDILRLQKQVEQLAREKRQLPHRLSELESKNGQLEEELRRLRSAKKEAADARQDMDRLALGLAQKTRTVERLSRQLDDNQHELDELAGQLAGVQRDRGELEQEREAGRSSLQQVQERVADMTLALDEAAGQVEGLQEALAQRDLQLKQAEAVIQVLQKPGRGVRVGAPAFAAATPPQSVSQKKPATSSRFEAYLKSRRKKRSLTE